MLKEVLKIFEIQFYFPSDHCISGTIIFIFKENKNILEKFNDTVKNEQSVYSIIHPTKTDDIDLALTAKVFISVNTEYLAVSEKM